MSDSATNTFRRRSWQDELEIIDRTMKAISGVTDPEKMVSAYWNGIGELLPMHDYLSISRRGVEPPYYLVTRSSRFTEDLNPWTQRERLPRLRGGIVGEIAYANKPVIIDDLPGRLGADDPAHFYLAGFQSLVAFPQYDDGEALNILIALLPAGAEIDRSMIPMLHWQAGLFGRGTQNLVLRNQLSSALAELDRELKVVGEIQRSLLPQALPEIPGFEIAAHYETSARAGGDYYDFFPLAPDSRGATHPRHLEPERTPHDNPAAWGLFIADVSGHGTPAAVLMAITHAIAHAKPGTHTPPERLLAYLDRQLAAAYTRNGTFVTAFYGVLDPASRTLTYARAGHNPPRLLRHRGREIVALDGAPAMPLGIFGDQPFSEATITLDRGDVLLLYTDGITEARAPRANGAASADPATAPLPASASIGRELFGVERLDALLRDCADCSAGETMSRVCAAVAAFSENSPLVDDQTLIAIRCV